MAFRVSVPSLFILSFVSAAVAQTTKPVDDYPAMRKFVENLQREVKALRIENLALREQVASLTKENKKLQAVSGNNEANDKNLRARRIQSRMA